MKKMMLMGCLLVAAMGYLSYFAIARGGGDAFVGGLGGSMMGSMIGSAVTSRPSGGGDGGGRAHSRIDRLEDIMRNDINRLNDKIIDLDRRLSALERK